MKAQNLKTACIKTLSKSELYDQREFNGVTALKNILGDENRVIETTFILRGSNVSAMHPLPGMMPESHMKLVPSSDFTMKAIR